MSELDRYIVGRMTRREALARREEQLRAELKEKIERQTTQATKREITREVQVAAHRADGAMALGAHIMQGAVELDQYRQLLAKGDPLTNAILGDIEAQALFAVKKIQARLYSEWDM